MQEFIIFFGQIFHRQRQTLDNSEKMIITILKKDKEKIIIFIYRLFEVIFRIKLKGEV